MTECDWMLKELLSGGPAVNPVVHSTQRKIQSCKTDPGSVDRVFLLLIRWLKNECMHHKNWNFFTGIIMSPGIFILFCHFLVNKCYFIWSCLLVRSQMAVTYCPPSPQRVGIFKESSEYWISGGKRRLSSFCVCLHIFSEIRSKHEWMCARMSEPVGVDQCAFITTASIRISGASRFCFSQEVKFYLVVFLCCVLVFTLVVFWLVSGFSRPEVRASVPATVSHKMSNRNNKNCCVVTDCFSMKDDYRSWNNSDI